MLVCEGSRKRVLELDGDLGMKFSFKDTGYSHLFAQHIVAIVDIALRCRLEGGVDKSRIADKIFVCVKEHGHDAASQNCVKVGRKEQERCCS